MIAGNRIQTWVSALVCVAGLCAANVAEAASGPAATVTPDTQRTVVTSLVAALNETYIFPDVAKNVDAALRNDIRQGKFDAPRPGEQFAHALTQRLRDLTRDKHLGVRYSAEPLPPDRPENVSPEILADRQAAALANMRSRNFSIARVERLKHNIGYINVVGFDSAEGAADTIAAAMRLVAYTDALIIDLRENGGGYPDGVAQLESYFFDKRTHLVDMYFRKDGSTQQTWTQDKLAGPRYGEARPLYLLTSRKTFSGGEDMAYTMQQLKRATIVGETSGGGANAGSIVRLSDHFDAFIPFARPINPITRDNWEGKGVTPNVAAPADRALQAAQIAALRKFMSAERDPAKVGELQKSIAALGAARLQ